MLSGTSRGSLFFDFLDAVNSISPLAQVCVCVQAPIRWFVKWHDELKGEFDYYSEPVHVVFKRIPNKAGRRRIEQVFGFKEDSNDGLGDERIWESDVMFTIRVLEESADPDELLKQLKRVSEIVPVEVAGIGVMVNL